MEDSEFVWASFRQTDSCSFTGLWLNNAEQMNHKVNAGWHMGKVTVKKSRRTSQHALLLHMKTRSSPLGVHIRYMQQWCLNKTCSVLEEIQLSKIWTSCWRSDSRSPGLTGWRVQAPIQLLQKGNTESTSLDVGMSWKIKIYHKIYFRCVTMHNRILQNNTQNHERKTLPVWKNTIIFLWLSFINVL